MIIDPPSSKIFDDQAYQGYKSQRQQHWDAIAQNRARLGNFGRWYHRRLEEIYAFLISANQRVLELGCSEGDLLASLKPAYGVGVDFSTGMVERARSKHPELTIYHEDVHDIALDQKFDVIILSDLLNDLWDVQGLFTRIHQHCTPATRIIINSYNRLWQPTLELASWLKLSTPNLQQNWLTVPDIANLLDLSGFEVIRSWSDILLPIPFLGLGYVANHYLVKLWPFSQMALTNFIVARPVNFQPEIEAPSVSIIVPARNEAGNIRQIFQRTPQMGSFTELVFVEGHSSDNTLETIHQIKPEFPDQLVKIFQQKGKGKGDAVRLGFERASGDILMILDADLTVPPEYLPRFYHALAANQGEFINGVRLVYPMEKEAMRFFNFLGNKFFSLAFSWLLGQSIKDTLCGTKVLWKADYQVIAANRSYFGDFDPFGDFDLLFGAARQNRKIVDLPIRYRERTYGTTNIQRWKHGLLLLRMAMIAAFRLKFI